MSVPESHTFQEITDQPREWQATLSSALEQRGKWEEWASSQDGAGYVFVGAGTSYYLALTAAAIFTEITGKSARAVPPSDILLSPQSIFGSAGKHVVIAISRSGTTTETLRAARWCDTSLQCSVLAISCQPDSPLVQQSRTAMLASEAAEISTVMTKSFTSMLLLLQVLSGVLAQDEQFLSAVSRLPAACAAILEASRAKAEELGAASALKHIVYLGQGARYGLASEGMLKAKEMSLTFSEAFHTLEYRHGPKALVTEETLAICLGGSRLPEYEHSVLREIQSFNGTTCLISDDAGTETGADHVLQLNSGLPDVVRSPLYMPFVQYLGYYRAVQKGLDPDSPRHLTPVVVLPAGEGEENLHA